jgi:hypothetical protein
MVRVIFTCGVQDTVSEFSCELILMVMICIYVLVSSILDECSIISVLKQVHLIYSQYLTSKCTKPMPLIPLDIDTAACRLLTPTHQVAAVAAGLTDILTGSATVGMLLVCMQCLSIDEVGYMHS